MITCFDLNDNATVCTGAFLLKCFYDDKARIALQSIEALNVERKFMMKFKKMISSLAACATVAGSLLTAFPVLANETMDEVFRLYNPNSGEHLYTTSRDETAALVPAGWKLEGIAWESPNSGDPVFRLFNPNAKGGDHHYTKNAEEIKALVGYGWKLDYDGNPVFYSSGDINVYVSYNPNAQSGAHMFTTDKNEQDHLQNNGWLHGAVAWTVAKDGHAIAQDDPIWQMIENRTPSENWIDSLPNDENGQYIVNKHTKKIHSALHRCRYVSEISPENWLQTNVSLEELQAHGFVPCKICW